MQTRTLKERIKELREISELSTTDVDRLWILAEDLDDECERLRDMINEILDRRSET